MSPSGKVLRKENLLSTPEHTVGASDDPRRTPAKAATKPVTDDELNDLKTSASGRQRGRKKGSGLGQKRKRVEEYSTNPHTIKARQRYSSMSAHARQVQAAKTADASAVCRKKAKLKSTPDFQALDKEAQQAALEKVKLDTLNSRTEEGYSAQLVISEKLAMLQKKTAPA